MSEPAHNPETLPAARRFVAAFGRPQRLITVGAGVDCIYAYGERKADLVGLPADWEGYEVKAVVIGKVRAL